MFEIFAPWKTSFTPADKKYPSNCCYRSHAHSFVYSLLMCLQKAVANSSWISKSTASSFEIFLNFGVEIKASQRAFSSQNWLLTDQNLCYRAFCPVKWQLVRFKRKFSSEEFLKKYTFTWSGDLKTRKNTGASTSFHVKIHFSMETTKFLMKYDLLCFQISHRTIIFNP